jgi:hypothetical protein
MMVTQHVADTAEAVKDTVVGPDIKASMVVGAAGGCQAPYCLRGCLLTPL